MSAVRLPRPLLLVVVVSVLAALTVSSASPSTPICSAPACLVEDAAACDRTTQDCPRCLMHDPLLDTILCTNIVSGGECLSEYTLCPATALVTNASDAGSKANSNTTDATHTPMTTSTTTPSPQPSSEQPVATSGPTQVANMKSASASAARIPTWLIIAVVAAVCVFVVVAAGVLYNENRQFAQSLVPTTPPLPHWTRNDSTRNANFATFPNGREAPPPPPPPSASIPMRTKEQEPAMGFKPSMEYKPSTAPTVQMSGLHFSQERDSYLRHSSVPDIELLTDSHRSAVDDSWNVESEGSLGVDDTASVESDSSSRIDHADFDMFSTTVRRSSECGPTKSPHATAAGIKLLTDSQRSALDRDAYQQTRQTTSAMYSIDTFDERESYSSTSLPEGRLRTQSFEEWKANYDRYGI